MNIAFRLADMISKPCNPPPAWRNGLPEAFAACDEQGNVTCIGYLGEWYVPIKLKWRVRLHNWLVHVGVSYGMRDR